MRLTKEIADILCMIITMGFAKKEHERSGIPLAFEYDEPDEKAGYTKVQEIFNRFGIEIKVRKSVSQKDMPYILGHNLPDDKLARFTESLDDFTDKVNKMIADASGIRKVYGAYIGGAFKIDSNGKIIDNEFNIVGASELYCYTPRYRTIDNEVGKSYYKSLENTDLSVYNILSTNNIGKNGFEFNEDYIPETLFGSVHGMIKAMCLFPDKTDTVYAEIALGEGTKKVSSCVPCAIFMDSFGMPATSIHLGRGDNWNLPQETHPEFISEINQWKNDIVNYYYSGLEEFKKTIIDFDSTNVTEDVILNKLFLDKICKNLNISDRIEEIPDIFLEALTFEGRFTDRIINANDFVS